MYGKEKLVAAVMQAADGEIIGRIRMQKIVYLLEQLGMKSGFIFSYYHYGPYSEGLSFSVDVAKTLDKTVVEEEIPIEGGFYSKYTLGERREPVAMVGELPLSRAQGAIRRMKLETSVVIELAATIHWLRYQEKVPDWRQELKIRKPTKADDARIKKALDLLHNLNLLELSL